MSSLRYAVAAIVIASWLGMPAYCAAAPPGRAASRQERIGRLEAENAQLRQKVDSLDGSFKRTLDEKTATYDRLYRKTTEELNKQEQMWTSMIVLYIGLVLGCSALLTYLAWRATTARIRDAVARRVQELVTPELIRHQLRSDEQGIAGGRPRSQRIPAHDLQPRRQRRVRAHFDADAVVVSK
jgi:hypothetical protein